MYIKSYLSGNGDNFVLKEAQEIECREIYINLIELYQEFNKDNDKLETPMTITEHFEYTMVKNAKIDPMSDLTSMFDFEYLNNETSVELEKMRFVFNLMSYYDQNGDKKFFVPCGITYIVNDSGATISTINKKGY